MILFPILVIEKLQLEMWKKSIDKMGHEVSLYHRAYTVRPSVDTGVMITPFHAVRKEYSVRPT